MKSLLVSLLLIASALSAFASEVTVHFQWRIEQVLTAPDGVSRYIILTGESDARMAFFPNSLVPPKRILYVTSESHLFELQVSPADVVINTIRLRAGGIVDEIALESDSGKYLRDSNPEKSQRLALSNLTPNERALVKEYIESNKSYLEATVPAWVVEGPNGKTFRSLTGPEKFAIMERHKMITQLAAIRLFPSSDRLQTSFIPQDTAAPTCSPALTIQSIIPGSGR
jgi:hypothetical protein